MGVGLTSSEKKYLEDPYQFDSNYRGKLYHRIEKKVIASVGVLTNPNLTTEIDSTEGWDKLVSLILDNEGARRDLLYAILSRLSNEPPGNQNP